MKNNTIVFITENYASGGANKYTEDLIASTESSFKDIYVLGNPKAITSFDKNRIPKRAFYQIILIFNLSEFIKNLQRPLRLLLRILLFSFAVILNLISYLHLAVFLFQKKPQRVILCNGGYPASLYLLFAILIISKKYCPILTIVSTPTRKESALLTPLWKWIDSFVQNRTYFIAVNSEAIKNDMVTRYHFASNKIKIVRNGVLDQKIKKIPHPEKITIGFISRVEGAKGIHELLEAYKKLAVEFPFLELMIAGSGSQESVVREYSKQFSKLNFLGHISGDLSEVLKQIDIFTLPSYQEGLPYSVIEACMASCAIVATNVGGIPEIITHNKSGLLVAPKDTDALYLSLKKLIEDKDLRLKFAQMARAEYEEQFTLDKMKEQMQAIVG